MLILHHGWRSSASRRVRLCLEEKGLAYEDHVVDMAGQMLAIAKKDPKVLASYENFVIGLRGPQ